MITVLYVDDEPDLLDITKLFLERSHDITVYTAVSVKDGLNVLSEKKIDVIVSDFQMPEKDGIQFLKEVRSRQDKRPFIIFTGRGREEIVIEAINSGVDFYLQKGGNPKAQFAELAHKIKQGATRYHAEEEVLKKHEELQAAFEELAASEEELKANYEELMNNRLALSDSIRRQEDIINFLPDATFAIDANGRIIAWNKAIEGMTGFKAGEMIGKGNYEHALPFYGERLPILIDYVTSDLPGIEKRYNQIIREGERISAETSYAKRCGEYMVAWCIATPLYNDKGEVSGAIESIRDITLQKQREMQIRENENLYRGVIENIQDAYYRTDTEGNLILASPSFLTLFGYDSMDEILNKPIAGTFYVNPEKRSEFLKKIQNTGFVENEEIRVRKKDGTPFIISTSSHYYTGIEGKIAGVEGVFRDITKQKQAEHDLIESKKHLQSIIENAPFGVHMYELQEDDRLVFSGANRAADLILGVEHTPFISKTIEEAFPPLADTDIPDMYRNVARTGRMAKKFMEYSDNSGIAGSFQIFMFQTGPDRLAVFFVDTTKPLPGQERMED